MRKLLLFSSFLLADFAILVISLLSLTIYTSRQSRATATITPPTIASYQRSYASYNALPTTGIVLSGKIVAADARPALVDNFFKRYHSPMEGLGADIVASADRYQIPFNLLPAIAQCEGNAGKKMPANSFNPYGFGIYGDKVTRFDNWQQGIEIVSKSLRADYFDFGFDTPEEIMGKYAPPSEGSWAFCITKFIEELR